MKKTLLLLSVFTSAIASAQLTQANEPAIGDTQIMYMCDTSYFTKNTAAAGNGVTWDFTNCGKVSNGATRTVAVKTPSTITDKYPSATKAIDIQGYMTSYFSSTATARNSKGMQFTQPGFGEISVILNDANDEKVMEYPYNFGNSHLDNFTGEVKSTQVNTTCTGKGNFRVDGKGTLKLNAATTLANVLRYKLEDSVDASTTFAGLPVTIKIIRTQFEYYDLDNSKELPVFVYGKLRMIVSGALNTDVTQKLILSAVQPDGVASLTEAGELNVSIYPNPTTGIINISGLTSEAVVTITDLQGKTVYSNTVSNGQIAINEFQAGVYVMEVVSAEGKATQRIVKN